MDLVILDLDKRVRRLRDQESRTPSIIRQEVDERFLAGWVYHDLSIEGWVFRDDEIIRALEGHEGSTYLEIQLFNKVRYFRRMVRFVDDHARHRMPFTLDFVKDIHRQLNPDSDDSAGRYRKGSGETRVYRHEMMSTSAISYRLRRLVSYVENEAVQDHPIKAACQIHKRLIDIFPFTSDNGIVARMAMNFWLVRHGYPPALITVHERQRYFDTYLSSNGVFQRFVIDTIRMMVEARLKGLEDHRCQAGASA